MTQKKKCVKAKNRNFTGEKEYENIFKVNIIQEMQIN